MKKFLAISIISTILYSSTIMPAFAIVDNQNQSQNQKVEKKWKLKFNKKENETSILDYINYDWWKKQNDSYLEKYISTAIEKNHDIKIAKLNIEQAQINVMSAKSNQLPTLTFGVSPFVAKTPGTTKTDGSLALPIMASYELDLFGKNWDKTKSAKKLLEGTVFQTQASDIAVVSFVGTTYYNIVKLDKMISLQEKLLEDRSEIYRLMKLLNKEGIVSTSDLILAEKNYVLAQNDLLNYQKNRQNALNALAVLIGDSAENTKEYERISYDKLPSKFNIPSEISSEIIVNRPDYKSLEKQLESAGIDIRIAKKEFLPTINILGLLTFLTSSSMGGGMDWNKALSAVGGSANIPIFDGFVRRVGLRANKNKYQQILERYQKANLVAIQEINDSLYNLKTDNEKFLNNVKALDIQKKDYNLTKTKYDKGIISKLDLLQQNETLLYVELLTAASKMDCFIDKISLYKSTGAQI